MLSQEVHANVNALTEISLELLTTYWKSESNKIFDVNMICWHYNRNCVWQFECIACNWIARIYKDIMIACMCWLWELWVPPQLLWLYTMESILLVGFCQNAVFAALQLISFAVCVVFILRPLSIYLTLFWWYNEKSIDETHTVQL